jgi:hypothetical protein
VIPSQSDRSTRTENTGDSVKAHFGTYPVKGRGGSNQVERLGLEIDGLELAQPHVKCSTVELRSEKRSEFFADLNGQDLCACVEQRTGGLARTWADLQDLTTGSESTRRTKVVEHRRGITRAPVAVMLDMCPEECTPSVVIEFRPSVHRAIGTHAHAPLRVVPIGHDGFPSGVSTSTGSPTRPPETNSSRYSECMIRTLDLHQWAGQWVALDNDGRVHASAAALDALMSEIDKSDLDLEIMRAPVPGEPLVFGLG